jgi:hypothetical protein
LTDEPYNVKVAGNVTRGDHREFAMASGEMTDAEFLAFNGAWIATVLPYLCDGGSWVRSSTGAACRPFIRPWGSSASFP